MLSSVSNIKAIVQSILEIHKKETADNTALKLIERKRAEAVKAQNNIVRAIEQGIITDATKSRLTELESQIAQYDIEINKEKARSYTFLTADDIEMYLSKFVFENTDDIKVRKLIVNTFIREVILYDDEIVITYNFTDSPERRCHPARREEGAFRRRDRRDRGRRRCRGGHRRILDLLVCDQEKILCRADCHHQRSVCKK